MLRWATIFLIIAIAAAVVGFSGLAAGATSIVKLLSFLFIILFLSAVVLGTSPFRRR